jgi:hypothetical protein
VCPTADLGVVTRKKRFVYCLPGSMFEVYLNQKHHTTKTCNGMEGGG